MIFLLPFHTDDFEQAQRWLRWVVELGGCRAHEIILMPARTCADILTHRDLAEAAFGAVEVFHDSEGINGHPEGPNAMMRQAIWHMQVNRNEQWTFIESDCIPRVSDWADQWEREYRAFGKPFMGELRPASGVTPDYLTGNMVLPKDALLMAPLLARRGLSRDGVELAFDIVAASQTLPRAHLTKLLQQEPKHADGSSHTFPDQDSLKLLRPGAVLFHPCKDESLFERLREQMRGGQVESRTPHKPEIAGSIPAPATPPEDPRIISLLKRIDELQTENAKLRFNGHAKKSKKKRGAIEQARINVRMAKLRERKKVKA